jgi:tRNA(adenine34) deaminase
MINECPFPKKSSSALKNDEYFMSVACNQAIEAWKQGEIPIGAIAVVRNQIIASSYNVVITLNNSTTHAEMQIITRAIKVIGDWRRNDITIYVTKEPCPMCSGAIIMGRVGFVIFRAPDNKMVLLGVCFRLQDLGTINHRPIVQSGVLG